MAGVTPAVGVSPGEQFDPHRQDLARRYWRAQNMVGWGTFAVVLVCIYSLMELPLSVTVRDWAESVSGNPGVVVGLYALVCAGAWMLLMLPLVFVSSYVVPRRFGLVALSPGKWWLDYAKTVAWTLLVWLVGIELLYWSIRTFPGFWWLPAAVLLWLYLALGEYLAPLTWRLFVKMRPLEDPVLAQRLTHLAARAGIPAVGVYVVNLSRSTPGANAWLMGMGGTRRIVLADTLLQGYTYDELESILAHELGHHVHNDIPKQLALKGVFLLVAMWLAFAMLDQFAYFGDTRGPADVASMPYLLAALAIEGVLTGLIGGYMSREAERSADLYAMNLTGNPQAFRSSMIKLADQNLLPAQPSSPTLLLGRTHPDIAERISAADRAAGLAPVYVPENAAQAQPGWSSRTIITIAVGGVILLAAAFGGGMLVLNSVLARVAPTYSIPVNAPSTGPEGSWAEAIRLAQKEAAQVDPSAVLYSVMVYPYDEDRTDLGADTVLSLVFTYVTADGGSLDVSMLDTDPPTHYYTSAKSRGGQQPSAAEQQAAVLALSSLRVSPRRLLVETLQEGTRFGTERGEKAWFSMMIDLSGTQPGWPGGWNVIYSTSDEELVLDVAPETGKVVSREAIPVDYEDDGP
jgi:STE24 endopeptidase